MRGKLDHLRLGVERMGVKGWLKAAWMSPTGDPLPTRGKMEFGSKVRFNLDGIEVIKSVDVIGQRVVVGDRVWVHWIGNELIV